MSSSERAKEQKPEDFLRPACAPADRDVGVFLTIFLSILSKVSAYIEAEDKKHNRDLARERVPIEHVNRRCKIFRIVKETYRGKHKNYSKTSNVIAALVNLRYAA